MQQRAAIEPGAASVAVDAVELCCPALAAIDRGERWMTTPRDTVPSEKLPNLFIIGYPKCGTTSLFAYLTKHPGFCGSCVKEPNFFSKREFKREAYDLFKYSEYFAHCEGQRFRFEGSVSNIYGGRDLAIYLKETCAEARAIVMLRDPVRRLYSFYRSRREQNIIDPGMTFDAFIDEGERRIASGRAETADESIRLAPYLWRGYASRYTTELFVWLDVFGDDLFIGFTEDLKKDPADLCDRICAWLGAAPLSEFSGDYRIENVTIAPKNYAMHRWARRLNKDWEAVLRRQPWLKRSLRRVYGTVNVRAAQDGGPTPAQIERLEQLLAPSKARLREELRRRRPDLRLPAWLAESAEQKLSA